MNFEMENPALAARGVPFGDVAGSNIKPEDTPQLSIDQDSRCDFVLAALRATLLRVRLIEHELTAAGIALKGGLISPETALEWAGDVAPGCLCFVPNVSSSGAAA